MEPFKFTTIAHADHLFCSPLSSPRADRLLGLLSLHAGDRALDVGCGKGELLIRLAEQYCVAATGIDLSPAFLADAQSQAAARLPSGAIQFRRQNALEFAAEEAGGFDAALCIGSTHAYGSWTECLHALAAQVRSGGLLLLGHGYWKQQPHPDYLSTLGCSAADYTDHAGNVDAAEAHGLIPLYSATSSDEEWDEYEGLFCRAVERHVRAHPEDADAPAMTERIRSWRRTYLRHGRDTLGFGFYLFQTP